MTLPIGTIVAYPASIDSLPDGWLPCNGLELTADYQELIAIIGNKYTPDLKGRTLIGAGLPSNAAQTDGVVPNFPTTAFVMETTGGEYMHTLSGAEVPPHTHALKNNMDSEDGSNNGFFTPPAATEEALYDTTSFATPHNNMQPFYVLNYIIFTGVFLKA